MLAEQTAETAQQKGGGPRPAIAISHEDWTAPSSSRGEPGVCLSTTDVRLQC